MLLRIGWPEHGSLDPLWYKVDFELHCGSNGVEAAWPVPDLPFFQQTAAAVG